MDSGGEVIKLPPLSGGQDFVNCWHQQCDKIPRRGKTFIERQIPKMFDAVGIKEDTMRFMCYKRLMPSAYHFILFLITLKPNPIEEIYNFGFSRIDTEEDNQLNPPLFLREGAWG